MTSTRFAQIALLPEGMDYATYTASLIPPLQSVSPTSFDMELPTLPEYCKQTLAAEYPEAIYVGQGPLPAIRPGTPGTLPSYSPTTDRARLPGLIRTNTHAGGWLPHSDGVSAHTYYAIIPDTVADQLLTPLLPRDPEQEIPVTHEF